MNAREKRAYDWALGQKFNSVAARYAGILARYIQANLELLDTSKGKQVLHESIQKDMSQGVRIVRPSE